MAVVNGEAVIPQVSEDSGDAVAQRTTGQMISPFHSFSRKRRQGKRYQNSVYHCSGSLPGHEYHLCKVQLSVWRPPYQQHEHIRADREYEHLVQVSLKAAFDKGW
jgi:hypothetical protein